MSYAEYVRRIAVTGGAGFIGSNLLLHLIPRHRDCLFVNVDCLTYAGNLTNLRSIESATNYHFERVDICDLEGLRDCFDRHDINAVIHLAAESHVDRSILGPAPFISTNILGTFNLLELARAVAEKSGRFRFHHVSTDEVFGSADGVGAFTEESSYRPNSPYSASKASADHLVRAYHRTYGLDTVTTNCTNNYGPYQFPEKLIPLAIRNAIKGLPIPVYGDGRNVRDWLFVEDHCRALEIAFFEGATGETYNVSGGNQVENVNLVGSLCGVLDNRLGGEPRERLIALVKDRPGHDRRYALDAARITRELSWRPSRSLEEGLELTVDWYLANAEWLEACTSGEYREYYQQVYGGR